MAPLPTWLTDQTRTYSHPAPDPTPPTDARVGDLWWIRNDEGERALVAIILIGDGDRIGPLDRMSISLCTTDFDMASDESLLFTAVETGAPYPVLVTGMVGPIERSQLLARVGHLPVDPDGLEEAIECGAYAPDLLARRGLPLHGRSDTRVALLEDECERLWRFLAPLD